jgi:hypothetical protein
MLQRVARTQCCFVAFGNSSAAIDFCLSETVVAQVGCSSLPARWHLGSDASPFDQPPIGSRDLFDLAADDLTIRSDSSERE